MSKEKQCECCHEWWYGSDVKENLCPNCYDYFKQLKRQIAEKEKELAYMIKQAKKFNNEAQKYYEDAYCNSFQNQKAIAELEKVNGILTDTIIEVTQNEMDLNKLCYLEEISARFYEKMQGQIKLLKGE